MNPKDPFGLVGQVLDGQFRVDGIVGEGGFSVVYRGHHQGLNEPIAVKCLKLPSALGTSLVDSFVQRFRDESRILYRLSQGNLHIVRSIAAGTTQAPITNALVPFMVLEWLDGRSLQTDLSSRPRGDGRSIGDVITLFASAADGLAYAHAQGVVHRDLNPGNLFLVESSRGPSMKVLDFGVAKIMHDGQLKLGPRAHTVGQIRIFAPAYGAPEQFDDRIGPVGAASDVYAFALILLEALQGKAVNEATHLGEFAQLSVDPARRPTPRSLGLTVDDEIESAFARATSLDPRARWQSVGDFWKCLTNGVKVATERKYEKAAQETPSLSEKPAAADATGAPQRASLGALGRTMPLNASGFASPFVPRSASVPPGANRTGSGSLPAVTPSETSADKAEGAAKADAKSRAGKQTMMMAGGPPRMGAAPSPPRKSAFPPPSEVDDKVTTVDSSARSDVETERQPASQAATVERPLPVGAFAPEAEDDEEATRIQVHPTELERNVKGTSIGIGAVPPMSPSLHGDPEVRAPLDVPPVASSHAGLAGTLMMNPMAGAAPPGATQGALPPSPAPFSYGSDPRISQMHGAPQTAPFGAPQAFAAFPDPSHTPPPYGAAQGGYPDPSHTPPPYGAPNGYPDPSQPAPPYGAPNGYPDPSQPAPPYGAVSQPYQGYPSTASGQHGALGAPPQAGYPGGSSQMYAPPGAAQYAPTTSGGYPAMGNAGLTPPPPGVDVAGGYRPSGDAPPVSGLQPAGHYGAPSVPGAMAPSQEKKFPVIAVVIAAIAVVAIGGGLAAWSLMGHPKMEDEATRAESSAAAVETTTAVPPPGTAPPVETAEVPPADPAPAAAADPEPAPTPTNEAPTPTPANEAPTPAPTATAPKSVATAVPTNVAPATVPVPKPSADPNAWNEANAKSRLATANGVLIICRKGTVSGPGVAKVTFESSGSVSSVILEPPYAGTKEGECASGQFRRVKVNPFNGGPQTVRHSFDVPK